MNIVGLKAKGGGGGGGPFVFSDLYTASKKGAWYDATDKTGLFNGAIRSAGEFSPTTGDSVYVMADRSELGAHTDFATWLAAASELNSNPTMATDTAWTTAGAVVFDTDGYLWDGSAGTQEVYQSQSITSGDWYIGEVTTGAVTSGSARIVIGSTAAANALSAYDIDTGSTTYTFFYPVATSGGTSVRIQSNTGDPFDGKITSFSVKRVPGKKHLFGVGAGAPIMRNDGTYDYLEFDTSNRKMVTNGAVAEMFSDDSIVLMAMDAFADGNIATAWSYNGGTRILFANASPGGGTGGWTPSIRNPGTGAFTEVWDHGAQVSTLSIYEIYMDDTDDELTVRLNSVEELAATSTTGGWNTASGNMELGNAQAFTNHQEMDFYRLIIYEGTSFNEDAFDLVESELGL